MASLKLAAPAPAKPGLPGASAAKLRVLIITSCTGEKASSPDGQMTLKDFRKGPKHVKAREKALSEHLLAAGKIYTGSQHLRLAAGVEAIREALQDSCDVKVWILSAGYGLVPEARKVAPYECTFSTMSAEEIVSWAKTLRVPADFRRLVGEEFDLALILLGDNYLKACQLDSKVRLGGTTILFAGSAPISRLPRIDRLRTVAIANPEAKRFSCGVLGLKGELAARLLGCISKDASLVSRLADPATDVLALLDAAPSVPKSLKRPGAVANSTVDRVVGIPEDWWSKPHRSKLRYFIPDWDDLVDPSYDFSTDQHSGGGGDWSNEVYAHQMYPEPNYDGLLVSRAVAEKSKKKDKRINALGVHRFLRMPRRFPIMGDCGAFDYIMQENPPYTTEDVLDYYTRLGFDYGVSVDHLIVAATGAQRQFRYDLTIDNAADFIRRHKKTGLSWTPVGAVQGWDPASYASAAAKYVKMGYQYIALGGLVRSTTKDILSILTEVRTVVPQKVKVHLFGIARPGAIPAMLEAGANSIDSASHLRRAWLGAGQNYFALGGGSYAAARIPQPGKSFRAKRMVSEGRATLEKVEALEQRCLKLIRAFDAGKAGMKETLDALCEYDTLVTEGRMEIRPHLERLLTDKPWKSCPCAICKKDGVEVVIFRGNNRNRRRGFHNTYVFYRQLQEAVASGRPPSSLSGDGDDSQMPLFDAGSAA